MVEMIKYSSICNFSQEQLANFYGANGWKSYLQNLPELQSAVDSSLATFSAWEGQRLIGLIRAVGDGHTILYIQDILVLPEYQRQGIGSELLRRMIDRYDAVRQIVLVTDDAPETTAFYQSMEFKRVTDYNCMAYMRYKYKD